MYSDPSDCLPRLASSEKKLLAHPDAAYYEPLKLPGRAVRFPAPADTSVQKVPHRPNASIHNASSLVPSTIHPKPDDATYHPTQKYQEGRRTYPLISDISNRSVNIECLLSTSSRPSRTDTDKSVGAGCPCESFTSKEIPIESYGRYCSLSVRTANDKVSGFPTKTNRSAKTCPALSNKTS